MINEEAVVRQFASYCRQILKYEKINYYQERAAFFTKEID